LNNDIGDWFMIPKVIIYNAVSIDGRINGFNADKKLYYELASEWDVDAVLMGSNTVLKGFNAEPGELREEGDFKVNKVVEDDTNPLLVVPDSGGKIRIWNEVAEMPFIRDILVLVSRSTPREYMDFLDKRNIKYMVIGYDKVNLGSALEELNLQFGVKSLRVDSGGTLNGVLLHDDLVDEICILIHPTIVGGMILSSIYTTPDLESKDPVMDLKLLKMEKLKNEIILLHYRVMRYQF
jgi:2,5-diamino-6-(ribosylamino)-4(3H)-pyrimidinone 5'-phosphate reductase